MAKSPVYVFTDDDIELGENSAVILRRHLNENTDRRCENYNYTSGDTTLQGIMSEIAVARYLGLDWFMYLMPTGELRKSYTSREKIADLEDFEVRSTVVASGHLRVSDIDEKRMHRKFILVLMFGDRAVIRGWAYGWEVKKYGKPYKSKEKEGMELSQLKLKPIETLRMENAERLDF